MKAKNQPPVTSESDAKEKLIIYVYEYLYNSGAKRAADDFLQSIQYERDIQVNTLESPGFLVNWWCVFWDLYCAAPDKKNLPEPTSEARAFHEFNMRQAVMSPSCTQTSPPQACPPPFMGAGGGPSPGGGPPMMGSRYGPPPPMTHQMRGGPPPNMAMGGPPPRMQTISPMSGPGGPPHPHQMGGPPHPMHPHHSPMMGSPRYTPHSGHMTPGSSSSTPMGPEPGPSPGLSHRMTPNHSGSPHPQSVGGPANGMGGGPIGGGAPPPGMPPQQQRAGLPQQTQQQGGWQNSFSVANSPADQQCFMQGPPQPPSQQQPPQQQQPQLGPGPGGSVAGVPGSGDFGSMLMNDGGGMMELKPNTGNGAPGCQDQSQQDEYVMPNYGQQADHHGNSEAGSEIMKLKESLESNDSDQTGFSLDYV